ncbi:membrane protein [Allostella vacuolata]|nr:membrane protein [Stella vacuolata]
MSFVPTAAHRPGAPGAGSPRRSAWIPWIFVGGMLLVVAVNAVMVRLAIGTFSGVTVERPYERGIAYNAVLAAQERQDRLGWTAKAELRTVDGRREIVLLLADREGRALSPASLAAHLERPLEPGSRRDLSIDPTGDGRYAAPIDGLQPGQWDVTIDARGPDGRLHVRQRLIAP